jgi:hypothetical protein
MKHQFYFVVNSEWTFPYHDEGLDLKSLRLKWQDGVYFRVRTGSGMAWPTTRRSDRA